jgi:hypothetical protein
MHIIIRNIKNKVIYTQVKYEFPYEILKIIKPGYTLFIQDSILVLPKLINEINEHTKLSNITYFSDINSKKERVTAQIPLSFI